MDYVTYKHLLAMFKEERKIQHKKGQTSLVQELSRTIESLEHLVLMH